MNATTNRLDSRHTPGFSEATGNELKQVEGGNLADTFKNVALDSQHLLSSLKDLLTCGGPNGQL